MKTLAENLSLIIHQTEKSFSIDLDWEFRPSLDKWSGKQVLGHLNDSAYNNIQRFIRGTHEEAFKIAYAQNKWVTYQRYEQAPIAEVFQLWTLLNKQIVRIWINYPMARIQTKSDVGYESPEILTIEEIAKGYIQHLNHHLSQIDHLIREE